MICFIDRALGQDGYFFLHFNSLRKRWIILHFLWETVRLLLQKCIMIQKYHFQPSRLKHCIFSPKRELSLVGQTLKILSA